MRDDQNRPYWTIEVYVSELQQALQYRIARMNDLIDEITPKIGGDTRLEYMREGYLRTIKNYGEWQRFLSDMETPRKLFLTFEDYKFFFTDDQ